MALTLVQLADVRTWLPWDPPTDAQIQAAHDQLADGSIYPLILQQLRGQLLRLVMTPASFQIVGEYGQNTAENMKMIRSLMVDAQAQLDIETGANSVSAASLIRPDPYRSGRTTPTTISDAAIRLI